MLEKSASRQVHLGCNTVRMFRKQRRDRLDCSSFNQESSRIAAAHIALKAIEKATWGHGSRGAAIERNGALGVRDRCDGTALLSVQFAMFD